MVLGSPQVTNVLLAALTVLLAFSAVQAGSLPGQDELVTKSDIQNLKSSVTRLNQKDFATESTLQGKLGGSTYTAEQDETQSTLSNIEDDTAAQLAADNDLSKLIGVDGQSTDSFGTVVTKGINNVIDFASNKPANPERVRLLRNGNRLNLQYNSFKELNEAPDAKQLRPDAGDTVTFESAESAPYAVAFEQWDSWALSINRSLQTGDFIRFGILSDDNGYFIEHNATNDNTSHVFLSVRRDGTITQAREAVLERPLTEYQRYELRTNWYNAGEQLWRQTFTDLSADDVQKNVVIGHTAPEGNRTSGSETQVAPLRFQVHRGSGNPPLQLSAGSMSALIAGDVGPLERTKTDRFEAEINVTEEWRPVAAIRIDPDDEFIRVELISLDLAEIEADTDAQIIAQQHEPSRVLQSNGSVLTDDVWSTPNLLSSRNSVVQFTNVVERAPNGTGSSVVSALDVGGFQVGWGSVYSTGNKGAATNQGLRAVVRPLYGSDVTVFWAKADDDGNPTIPTNVTVEYTVDMVY